MYLTVLGVILGGVVSWALTHVYYKISLRSASDADPIPHLKAITDEIGKIKLHLSNSGELSVDVGLSLDNMGKHLASLSHIFRHSLQGVFADIDALKRAATDENLDATRRVIAEMESHMRRVQRAISHPSFQRSSDSSDVAPDLSGKRLLIVEDDTDLSSRLAGLLKGCGAYEVDTAASITDGLECLLNSGPYDLAILDVMLPETQGDHARIQHHEAEMSQAREILRSVDEQVTSANNSQHARLAQAREQRSKALAAINSLIQPDGALKLLESWHQKTLDGVALPPIIFLSAVGNEVIIHRGLELANCAYWFVKPISFDDILEQIVAMLDTTHATGKDMSK